MPAEPRQVCISFFNYSTEDQFWTHPSFMGHSTKLHRVFPGDIVLMYNEDIKCVTGIALLRRVENGFIYQAAHPYDKELYSDEYKKYNKYEIGVKAFRIDPVPIETINRLSGLPYNSPIVKGHHVSFKRNNTLASWANTCLFDAMIAEYV